MIQMPSQVISVMNAFGDKNWSSSAYLWNSKYINHIMLFISTLKWQHWQWKIIIRTVEMHLLPALSVWEGLGGWGGLEPISAVRGVKAGSLAGQVATSSQGHARKHTDTKTHIYGLSVNSWKCLAGLHNHWLLFGWAVLETLNKRKAVSI